MNTVYQNSVFKLVKDAYQMRTVEESSESKELIETTPEMKEIIESVVTYKNNLIYSWICNQLLKHKIQKKKISEVLIPKADLEIYSKVPIVKARRLPVSDVMKEKLKRSKPDIDMVDDRKESE